MPPSAPQQVPRTTSSRTTATTTTTTTTTTSTHTPALPLRTLRLRAVDGSPAQRESRHIQWAEDVVDNEGMGKKSSKVCCIYHKPREVGESSSEDTSDSSSSDSDSEPDNSSGKSGKKRADSGQ
ncbi:hypothetical protein P152DRAFT_270485 [Eremomyces bilateralis CBS 781.70]|uniref:Type 1 phosphatases regulator n=1 Tax=Eremomyces bilateralis CBS 781.70 TaxID=1392243 RepID=A0A6G1G8H5_9PEZI|nr:uncharacterized protein P152DRAFT_270485 [Eremomyces bilateralis CBS 781.70]KAF1814405.1 hypothetical protein P152DRAFT_270485 [Eremomyces bilateralis CBS 781.70]